MASRRRYSQQFKEEACKLVTERGYTWQQAAAKLGVGQSTFDYWMKQHGRLRADHPPPPPSPPPPNPST